MGGHEALAFESVTARYAPEGEPALRDCSFTVGAGERVALLGPNGSGKTTILLAAVGLVPYEGEIRVAGKRLEPSRMQEVRREIGFLFANPEDQILLPRVLDDVAFSLRSRGVVPEDADAAAREVLAGLGSSDLADRSPYRMSHGQRLRTALAGALVGQPPLLLLDEPTSGLDREGRTMLTRVLNEQPSALLVATHDLSFARSCCHRFIRVEGGRPTATARDFRQAEEDEG